MSEVKWYFLAVMIFFGGLFFAMALEDYFKTQVKIECIKANKEWIGEDCKSKP